VQVDDLPAARSFYTDLFGWEILDSPGEVGGYLMAMINGRPAAGLGPKPMPMPSAWTTYLAAKSADDIHAKVIAAGGQPFMEPFDVTDVGRMFVATDPTGAVFGVWEARLHTGAGIYNEPGSYTWNELQTRDFVAGREFYAKVFGYQYTDVALGPDMSYTTVAVAGAEPGAMVAGVNDLAKMPGDTPSHWLTWFDVADCDDTAATAEKLGSTIMSAPTDSPFGRMAIVAGPQGEAFGVIDINTTVGEPPPAS
jgi:hypothetical protein